MVKIILRITRRLVRFPVFAKSEMHISMSLKLSLNFDSLSVLPIKNIKRYDMQRILPKKKATQNIEKNTFVW